jgi:hypothetical protein
VGGRGGIADQQIEIGICPCLAPSAAAKQHKALHLRIPAQTGKGLFVCQIPEWKNLRNSLPQASFWAVVLSTSSRNFHHGTFITEASLFPKDPSAPSRCQRRRRQWRSENLRTWFCSGCDGCQSRGRRLRAVDGVRDPREVSRVGGSRPRPAGRWSGFSRVGDRSGDDLGGVRPGPGALEPCRLLARNRIWKQSDLVL